MRSAKAWRSSLSARYPVNGAWPAEMRIDMLAAYLDFRSVRELAQLAQLEVGFGYFSGFWIA